MALPTGDFHINANGFIGTLHIASVDPQGNVAGTLTFSGEPTNHLNNVAFWNDVAQELTFIRVINPSTPSTFQIFTGYLFPANHNQPNGPSHLAGSFQAFSGTGGTAKRFRFGWFANHT